MQDESTPTVIKPAEAVSAILQGIDDQTTTEVVTEAIRCLTFGLANATAYADTRQNQIAILAAVYETLKAEAEHAFYQLRGGPDTEEVLRTAHTTPRLTQ